MFPRGKDYTTYSALKNAAIEVYSITKVPALAPSRGFQ